MPGSTLVGVSVTTTHRTPHGVPVESGLRVPSRTRRPKYRRRVFAPAHESRRSTSGAVIIQHLEMRELEPIDHVPFD
jgi:hypothetical protein